ncbi:MAG: magnesium chelatase ATPase subunit D, partial [Pseudomonadota bacterium]
MSRLSNGAAIPVAEPAAAVVLLAIDPGGLGGAVLRSRPGPARDRWLAELRRLLPEDAPYVRVPVSVPHDRLLGGLDFGATMANGRPVYAKGLLEAAHGGVVGLSMAERLTPSTAAIIAAACDDGELNIERDGARRQVAARFGVIAFDEGLEAEEQVDAALSERLAFFLRPDETAAAGLLADDWDRPAIAGARRRLADVVLPDAPMELLVHVASAFGIGSMRAVNLAARCAKAAAAATGVDRVTEEHVRLAAQLVYPQRATRLPAENEQDQPPPPDTDDEPPDERASNDRNELPDDIVIDAVRANVPDGLLDVLEARRLRRQSQTAGSRGGPKSRSRHRGRP